MVRFHSAVSTVTPFHRLTPPFHAFPHRYLEALVLWRLLAFALSPVATPLVLLLTFGLCHLGGYWSLSNAPLLAWDHAAGFLPFFLAGYLVPLERLTTALPPSRALSAAGLMLTLGLGYVVTTLDPLPDNQGGSYKGYWAASEFEEAV